MSLIGLIQATPILTSHLLLVYALPVLVCLLVLRYKLAVAWFHGTREVAGKSPRPALIPSLIPGLGHVPVSFLWNPLGFVMHYPAFWRGCTVRLRVLSQDIYVIQGSEDILSLLKRPFLSSFLSQRFFIINVFGLPKAAAEMYAKDNSGGHHKPHPLSNVQHHNRVEFHGLISQQRLLLGPGKSSFFRRFDTNTMKRISALEIHEEWTFVPDFMAIFKLRLSAAVVDSLAGPYLMEQHPRFVEDLWTIEKGITGLMLKLPRFMNPKSHQARDRATDAVMDWHLWARENFTSEAVDEEGNDPFWGCAFFRERQGRFSNVDNFDSCAIACQDLGFFWGVNSNATISTFWITVEAFRNAEFLQIVKEEVQTCVQRGPEGELHFDIARLLTQPFLQAMFAESLRLHSHGLIVRQSQLEDIQVNPWRIPRHHISLTSATPALRDANVWCAGENSEHPVDHFWPGRFLKRDPATNKTEFPLAGTEGFWIPFGGGPHTCPGRLFAKRQNILTLALMVTLYDCEILAGKEALEMDHRMIPFGVVSPVDKVPVRLRRRAI